MWSLYEGSNILASGAFLKCPSIFKAYILPVLTRGDVLVGFSLDLSTWSGTKYRSTTECRLAS